MRKGFLTILFIFTFCAPAFAGSWSINCTNGSCLASQGYIQVYWSAPMDDIYSGKLTGVEGLPINMKDMQAAEKKVKLILDEIAPASKKDEKIEDKTGFGSSSHSVSSDSASINYMLSFVKWVGDTKYSYDLSIKRYWAASEYILEEYTKGDVAQLLDVYFMERNPMQLMAVPVNSKINDNNRQFLIAKWFSLKKLAPIGVPATLSNAYSILSDIGKRNVPSDEVLKKSLKLQILYGKNLDDLFAEYQGDMQKVNEMIKPGLNVEKLRSIGKKELASAMWIGNKTLVSKKDSLHALPLPNLYVEALGEVALDGDDVTAEIDKAAKSKDPSLTYIAVKGSPFPWSLILFGSVAFVGGGSTFFRLKKREGSPDTIA